MHWCGLAWLQGGCWETLLLCSQIGKLSLHLLLALQDLLLDLLLIMYQALEELGEDEWVVGGIRLATVGVASAGSGAWSLLLCCLSCLLTGSDALSLLLCSLSCLLTVLVVHFCFCVCGGMCFWCLCRCVFWGLTR